MNEFVNKLIVKEEPYENGLFPKIPKTGKHGSAILLVGGCNNDLLVTGNTTARQIRQGKYTRLVEVSTLPYTKEIRFNAPSKETYYSFDVYVKAVIQVNDPIVFYENKNIDVDTYFDNLFSLDVRKITRQYSILNYVGMDDELTQRLSSYSTIDPHTGFCYRISAVDAMPGENAQDYVQRDGKLQLEAQLKSNARVIAASLTTSLEEAIRTEIAEGKLSEKEGLLQIEEYKNLDFDGKLKRLTELREKGFITDKEAHDQIAASLEKTGTYSPPQQQVPSSEMEEFYTEE